MTGDEGPPAPGPAGGPGERPEEDRGDGPGPLPEEEAAAPEEDGPVGLFPSWGWLYAAVLAWFVVVVVALYVLTVTLDFGAP